MTGPNRANVAHTTNALSSLKRTRPHQREKLAASAESAHEFESCGGLIRGNRSPPVRLQPSAPVNEQEEV
jgi:hypothetical protein